MDNNQDEMISKEVIKMEVEESGDDEKGIFVKPSEVLSSTAGVSEDSFCDSTADLKL